LNRRQERLPREASRKIPCESVRKKG
jgi:hypothetical protein